MLLGRSTVADLVQAAGQPADASGVTEGTQQPFYLLEYVSGADGGVHVTFQAVPGPGVEVPFPDQEITASVCGLRIISVDLDAKGLDGDSWPASGLCNR